MRALGMTASMGVEAFVMRRAVALLLVRRVEACVLKA